MKPIFWMFLLMLLSPFILAAVILADVIVPAVVTSQWQVFVAALKGVPGFTSLAIAGAVVQFFMYIFKENLDCIPGRYKILIVQFLSILAGVISLRTLDFDWASCLLHANTLGAVQVFGHQLWKQWFAEKEEKYALPAKTR